MNPIEIIDRHSEAIARSLDIVVYSLDGLYEKTVRDNPSMQGIYQFLTLAGQVTNESVQRAVDQLQSATIELGSAVIDSKHVREQDLDADSDDTHGEAYEAFGAFFTQAKLFYAKRLREVVVSKSYRFDTYSSDPRIMTRNGRRWNFSEYAYLTSRQLLVDWHNNTKIAAYAAAGVTEYTLMTDDPELMYGVYEVENYPEDAPTLFHPRTTKLVGAPNVSSEPEM